MRRYDPIAMALHWLIAALALAQIALGWWMITLPDASGVQRGWFNLHKSIGLTIGALMLVRLAWRLSHCPPALPAGTPRWEERAAGAAHRLLYAGLIAQPVVGYLGSSFTAYPIKYFGAALPLWGWDSPPLKALLGGIHLGLASFLTLLVVVHVAAALRHLARRDGLFLRMWPAPRRSVGFRAAH